MRGERDRIRTCDPLIKSHRRIRTLQQTRVSKKTHFSVCLVAVFAKVSKESCPRDNGVRGRAPAFDPLHPPHGIKGLGRKLEMGAAS